MNTRHISILFALLCVLCGQLFAAPRNILFILADDPAEQTNLAATHPTEVERLAAAWTKWNQQNIPPLWGLPPVVKK